MQAQDTNGVNFAFVKYATRADADAAREGMNNTMQVKVTPPRRSGADEIHTGLMERLFESTIQTQAYRTRGGSIPKSSARGGVLPCHFASRLEGKGGIWLLRQVSVGVTTSRLKSSTNYHIVGAQR